VTDHTVTITGRCRVFTDCPCSHDYVAAILPIRGCVQNLKPSDLIYLEYPNLSTGIIAPATSDNVASGSLIYSRVEPMIPE
jgi:hypothetical protein